MIRPLQTSAKGYITLISVMVLGAISSAVAISALLLGSGFSRSSFALEQSHQAKALANACAEEGLQQIRSSTSFTGSNSLSLGQGTCDYTVTSQGGENRTIIGTGTVGTIVRKTEVIINDIENSLTVTSWQEVDDF